ncbi:MBL fold metallo-hydrolase [Synechococcus sp. CS-205]|uniref:MBL fold metallo-hydrolase n=1 Tax=Synechococcus sp. CS-205 TaxID=2847984 RepID=UPI00223A8A77|nr:MBL fold metallo-hydrolase [Synechococcus sp. CS-205]
MPAEDSGEMTLEVGRPPTPVMPGLWVFAPNRDTLGGTSWLLAPRGRAPLLIDAPAYTAANLEALSRAGAGTILLTSREGHGRCRRWQEALGWPLRLQEQEAYLLPGVADLCPFGEAIDLGEGVRALWTPGPTPGACVVHAAGELDVLFCGRLLVPTAPGAARPLRTARTFHWARQGRSLEALRRWLPSGSPRWIASGAGLGALQGEKLIEGGRALLDGLLDRP